MILKFSVKYTLFALLLPLAVWASDLTVPDAGKKENKEISDLVKEYSKSEMLSMAVVKKTTQKLLARTKTSNGKLYFSKDGRFHLLMESPNKTLVVFDGDYAWNEEQLPEDFGGGIKVLKSKGFKDSVAFNLLQIVMGKGKFNKYFHVIESRNIEGKKVIKASPSTSKWNISLISLEIKNDRLIGISYWDDVGNETLLSFDKIEFHKKIQKKYFQYKIPKGAEITTI